MIFAQNIFLTFIFPSVPVFIINMFCPDAACLDVKIRLNRMDFRLVCQTNNAIWKVTRKNRDKICVRLSENILQQLKFGLEREKSREIIEIFYLFCFYCAATASAAAVVVSLVFIPANNRITHLLTIKKWLNLQNF